MDTLSHITTGIGLAGLAFLDPTIANQPELFPAILTCTILGSNAPDIDFLLKLKGNETYVNNHRGLSPLYPSYFFGHSLLLLFAHYSLIALILFLSSYGLY